MDKISKELISSFCDPDGSRPNLATPLRLDNNTVVLTDSRILVILNEVEDKSIEMISPDFNKSIQEIINKFPISDGVITKKIKAKKEKTKECVVCNGHGTMIICPECYGYGVLEVSYDGKYCEYKDDITCLICNGDGIISENIKKKYKILNADSHYENCAHCYNGVEIELQYLKIGITHINNHYAHLLDTQLQDVKYVIPYNESNQLDPIPFIHSEGIGYITPIQKLAEK